MGRPQLSLHNGHHEEFNVEGEVIKSRLKVVRQDRINVDDVNCVIEIGEVQHRVLNISEFGLLVQINGTLTAKDVEALLLVNEVEIGMVHMRVVRAQAEAGGTIAAFEVMGEP